MNFFNKKTKLFPPIDPFDSGLIDKGVHKVYYEQCANVLLYTSNAADE